MPYRRLPNTDQARLRALGAALRKSISANENSSAACSEQTLADIQSILQKFQNAMSNLNAARKQQYQKNKEFVEFARKARLYVSHYIQVINFGILRGELKSDVREFYQLTKYGKNLPPIISDKNLFDWGKKIIDGDLQRIMKGGSPIYNPSMALVKVNYEKFAEAYRFQKILNSNSERMSKIVADLRIVADKVILQAWNEIEKFFEDQTESDRRELAKEYGLVYIYRKKELRKAKLQAEMELLEKIQNETPMVDAEAEVDAVESEVLKSIETFMKVEKTVILRKVEQTPKTDNHKVKQIKFPERAEHSPVQSVLNF